MKASIKYLLHKYMSYKNKQDQIEDDIDSKETMDDDMHDDKNMHKNNK